MLGLLPEMNALGAHRRNQLIILVALAVRVCPRSQMPELLLVMSALSSATRSSLFNGVVEMVRIEWVRMRVHDVYVNSNCLRACTSLMKCVRIDARLCCGTAARVRDNVVISLCLEMICVQSIKRRMLHMGEFVVRYPHRSLNCS